MFVFEYLELLATGQLDTKNNKIITILKLAT
jgi:hypothetical protein